MRFLSVLSHQNLLFWFFSVQHRQHQGQIPRPYHQGPAIPDHVDEGVGRLQRTRQGVPHHHRDQTSHLSGRPRDPR